MKETGRKAAQRHTKSDKLNFKKNLIVLKEVVEFSERKNIFILFYSSPAYKTYTENLDKTQYENTYSSLRAIISSCEKCAFYDLMESEDFDKNDFRDADHLNQSGAKKLTFQLNKLLIENLED